MKLFQCFISVLLLARLVGQYCFFSLASVVCRRRMSSVVVCNAVGERTGRRACGCMVGRQTLHGGPVRLRPVMVTPCFTM